MRFEEWLETGDDAVLADVERYNEEDRRSTVALHSGLLSLRPRDVPWRLPRGAPAERGGGGAGRRAGGAGGRAAGGRGGGVTRRLLGNLVDYHQREARPQWWAWFRWPQLDDDELIADRTAIGGSSTTAIRRWWRGEPPTG